MKRILPLFLLALLVACSGSKMMYKKGNELREAGLTKEAADYYIMALHRKRTNTKAIIALKATGQKVLDEMLGEFYQAATGDDPRKAVYSYREAMSFRDRTMKVGVELEVPEYYEQYYEESRDTYIKQLYSQAKSELEEEHFEKAEEKFKEIASLMPGYENVDELKNIAYMEPIYRKALEFYDQGKYRTAHDLLSQIIKIDRTYKDASRYADLCVESGRFTIGLMRFENTSNIPGASEAISAGIIRSIQNQGNPFIKIIDRTHTDAILKEQELGMTGPVELNTAAKAGEMIGAKALLVGTVVSARMEEGKLKRYSRPGWIADRVKFKNPETGETQYRTIYRKVYYQQFEQENRVAVSFQYKLISTETGEILLSDVIDMENRDESQYARYQGDASNLLMGAWTNLNKDEATDRVLSDHRSKQQLRSMLSSDGSIKSPEKLAAEIYDRIAIRVAGEIDGYNPDNG